MRKYLLLITIFALVSCSGSKKLSNQNLAYLVAPGLNFIYPEYKVYNLKGDTCRVFFNLDASELLFMKADDSLGFMAEYGFTYELYRDYESKQLLDSGQINFVLQQPTDSLSKATGYFDVHAPDSANYVLNVLLTDFNRRQAVGSFITIDRTGQQSPDNFIAIDMRTGKPMVSSITDREERIRILTSENETRKLYVRYFKNRYGLTSPPFGNDMAKPLSYSSDGFQLLDVANREEYILDKPGIYHFQYDTMVKEGFTIFRFDEDFPKLTDAASLIESIRFLTTREEFDKISNSKNQKQAVDEFWLKMAGNRERARVLIRNYYSRVQLANRFFTSYLEGWKSDRGLIYIIFGPPNTIYRTNESETWNYSQNYSYGPLNFTFDKLFNPFTNNDYKLRRSNYYEMPWYRAVDSWRDGRVVNENN